MDREPRDTDLMLAVQRGDTQKLGILFCRHHVRIVRFCTRMTSNPALAEDLTQEAFLRVMRYSHSYRGSADFLPWLYRIARNVCHDHFRSSGAARGRLEVEVPTDLEDAAPLASATVERDEEATRLRQLVDELPIDRREALVLARFEERDYGEVAEILGCSVGAVRVRIHRALRQLAELYRRSDQTGQEAAS